MKTIVLGGYGNFGARICRALAADAAIALLVAGRDAARAQALASALGPRASAIALDLQRSDLAAQLRALGVELVIHTAGPFQAQGYAVAQAAAAAGAHYLDLADGRRFVCDFPAALDAAFRQAGRTAISGASTVPALSGAVVDALCAGWQQIDRIAICIAPAQTAPRGDATLAGVLSYCGEPVPVWLDGRWQARRGWARCATSPISNCSRPAMPCARPWCSGPRWKSARRSACWPCCRRCAPPGSSPRPRAGRRR